MTQDFHSLEDYLNIFRRRWVLIVSVAMVLLVCSTITAFVWPPTFRSTATILIVEQEVPREYVRSTITSYADQQIERIKAQVMTRSRLMPIIEEHNLYKDLRMRNTSAAALKQFIRDIRVEVLSSEVKDKRTGQQTQATIAFTLSYEGKTAGMTQKIANELTTLFLNENLRYREEQVQNTTAFVQAEAERFATQLSELDEKIANFKAQSKGALPELFQMNMQLLGQANGELTQTKQQIQEQEARIIFLRGQIVQLKNSGQNVTDTGEGTVSMAGQLKGLRRQYTNLASRFSVEHPDVVQLQGEIEALAQEVAQPISNNDLSGNLEEEKRALATLLEQYGEDHPDVVRTRATIALLEDQLTNPDSPSTSVPTDLEYNPLSVNLQTQLASAKTSLAYLQKNKAKLEEHVREYAARVERTTVLEPEYQALRRDQELTARKFNEYRSRLSEAQVAEGMEMNRKGERFSLVDPPSFPEEPVKPNRPAILLIGLLLALTGGIGAGAVAETLDGSIHTLERLQFVTKMAPLGTIPYVYTPDQLLTRSRTRKLVGIGAIGCVGISLVLVHVYWLPLDVIWFAALRKMRIG